MHDTAVSAITAWSNFYVITGSSAGSLTGLMFVVITLVDSRRRRGAPEGISTFSTPTVVHFGAALLVSLVLSAPWQSLVHVAWMLGITGLFGAAYVLRIAFRTRRQTAYRPGLDDWIWYTILPSIAYVAIVVSSILLPSFATGSLFAIAAADVLLVFIGIHNAWDIVTFIAMGLLDEATDAGTNGDRP
jgi:hypothetical protein